MKTIQEVTNTRKWKPHSGELPKSKTSILKEAGITHPERYGKLPIKNAFWKPGNAFEGFQRGFLVDEMLPSVDFLLPDSVFRG